jgi:hypothetical protein
MAVALDRTRVLAYRARAQALHGTADLTDLAALTIGLQDTPAGSAALGLRHRTAKAEPLDQPDLVLALTMRGSPHLHRRADLPLLRAALRPHDNEMLRAYLGGFGDTLSESGADGPALLARVADDLRDAFPGETASKGELSGAVTPRVPEIARPWCATCDTAHVADGLFRVATLYAGIELVPGEGRRQRFRLGAAPKSDGDNRAAALELIGTMVRLAGPLTLDDLVRWLDTRAVTSPPAWSKPIWADLADQLVEVEVAGTTLYATAEAVDGMRDAPAPPPVSLLPPRDPYLLGHRPFLVPDRAAAKELWRPVGSPGALVVDGAVAGVWRARKSGRTLRLDVTPHGTLTAKQRKAIDAQAEIVAAARDHDGKVVVATD